MKYPVIVLLLLLFVSNNPAQTRVLEYFDAGGKQSESTMTRVKNKDGTITFHGETRLTNGTVFSSVDLYDKNGIPLEKRSVWSGGETILKYEESQIVFTEKDKTQTMNMARKDFIQPQKLWFWKAKPKIGESVEAKILFVNTKKTGVIKYTYLKKETIEINGQKYKAFVVREEPASAKETYTDYWYDKNGMFIKREHFVGKEKTWAVLKAKI